MGLLLKKDFIGKDMIFLSLTEKKTKQNLHVVLLHNSATFEIETFGCHHISQKEF